MEKFGWNWLVSSIIASIFGFVNLYLAKYHMDWLMRSSEVNQNDLYFITSAIHFLAASLSLGGAIVFALMAKPRRI